MNHQPVDELGRLEKGADYNLYNLRFKGWSTPLGFRRSMDGYHVTEYFEGPYSGPARYLGPDSFGVEPLFELQ